MNLTLRQIQMVASIALCASLAGAGVPPVPEPRAGIEGCTVIIPSGVYAQVRLDFALPAIPAKRAGARTYTYVGAMRDGRMPMDSWASLLEPGGTLELKDGKLTGSFRYPNPHLNVNGEGNRWGCGDAFILPTDPQALIVVDATVKDGVIAGSAKIGEVTVPLSGTVTPEAQLAAQNKIDASYNWPAMQGPIMGGCSAMPGKQALVDDPAKFRLAWRCEEIGIGPGMGSVNRLMNTWGSAGYWRSLSGCGSPLLADGKIFFKYYVPAKRRPTDPEVPLSGGNYFGMKETEAIAKILAEAKGAGQTFDQLPEYAAQKVYQNAHDIMLCLDAATGRTLWKAIVKDRGHNYNHHKFGPYNMSPAYANGRVFGVGTSGWLYAFDAATGKPLWEAPVAGELSNALLANGDVVIAPSRNGGWGGFDAVTGKELWRSKSDILVSTLSAWTNKDQNYVIGPMVFAGKDGKGGKVACLEAKTGKEVWNLPIAIMSGGRGDGPGGITISGDIMLTYQSTPIAPKEGDVPAGRIAAYRLDPTSPKAMWELTSKVPGREGPIQGESVPVVVQGKYVFTPDIRTVDLQTGAVVDTPQGKNLPVPANGGYMQAIDDIVMVREDGTHGGISCGFYKIASDGRIRLLTSPSWQPPVGCHTTSYHHPIFYAMGDGRIFMRQNEGVFCWDLRATK